MMVRKVKKIASLAVRALRNLAELDRLFVPHIVRIDEDVSLVRMRAGHLLHLRVADRSLAPHILAFGEWEQAVTRVILDRVAPGMHVVEVGANIGHFTVQMAKRVGKNGSITAFECHPAVAELLFRNLVANGTLPNTKLIRSAVSDSVGHAEFASLASHNASGSLAPLDRTTDERLMLADAVAKFTVPVTTLDAALRGHRPPDVLKMDAEGSEAKIVSGAGSIFAHHAPRTIIMEHTPDLLRLCGSDPSEHLRRLTGLGYRIRSIEEDGSLVPIGEFGEAAGELLCERTGG